MLPCIVIYFFLITNQTQFFFSLGAIALQWALASSSFRRNFVVSRSDTTTRHIQQVSSGRVIRSSQRPLPDNKQHSQQTNIHASGGIRTHDLSSRAAVDLRLRPHGHCDRQPDALIIQIFSVIKFYMFRASSLAIVRNFHSSILSLLGSGHQTCMKLTSAECTGENS